jgi:ABC-2 type transport system ATP-binding protein
MSEQQNVVIAQGLKDRYGHRVVFDGLDLTLGGTITGLLGPNGAGKTTLLHLLCGLRRPTGGSLSVMGVDVTRRAANRELAERVGFLPQSFGYLPSYTVRDFVTYAGWLKKVPATELPAATERAIADVNLSDRAESRMRTLSGGMVRRVGIAAAVVHRPSLLLLDEPAAGLDPAQRAELRELLTRLSDSTCVIMSTHLIDDVRAICRDVVVLDNGQVRFTGTPDQLEASAQGPSAVGTGIEAGYLSVLSRPAREPR